MFSSKLKPQHNKGMQPDASKAGAADAERYVIDDKTT